MSGYDENFLQERVPLPTLGSVLEDAVLERETLRNNIYADFPHYTVVMNEERRAPIFVALNINQSQMETVDGRSFRIDYNQVGKENQLSGKYYDDNDYDKGHLAMRQNAAWGANIADAQLASDETHYYPNSTLQHMNLNRDEWVQLEKWVGKLDLDADDRITSFSGPIYGNSNRFVGPNPKAEVPSAFFKVVCFINKNTGKLDVRAFIVVQDEESMKDRDGHKIYNYQSYQTSVTEIQRRTGLEFDQKILDANPLLFTDNAENRAHGVTTFPERIEIDRPDEMIADPDEQRIEVVEDDIDVFIAAAMPNPKGADRGNEWVSILNIDNHDVDLTGWKLQTFPYYDADEAPEAPKREVLLDELLNDLNLPTGTAIQVMLNNKVSLNNNGGTIILLNDKGERVERVKYTKQQVREGEPVILFEYQPERS